MPGRVKVVKVCLQIEGWVSLVFSVLCLPAWVSLIWNGSFHLPRLALVPAVFLVLIGIGFGLFSLAVARGVELRRRWARISAIVIACVMLPSIGLGTVLGVLILVFIHTPDAKDWLAPAWRRRSTSLGCVQTGRAAGPAQD